MGSSNAGEHYGQARWQWSWRSPALSSSLILPEFSSSSKPVSLAEWSQQETPSHDDVEEPLSVISSQGLHTHENLSDYEPGADEYSTANFKNFTPENTSEAFSIEKSLEVGAHEVGQSSNSTFQTSTRENTPEEFGHEKSEESSVHHQNFQRTSKNQHAELHKEHRRKKARKARTSEQGLLAAKQAISYEAVTGATDLHAPVYQNLTTFTKSYELMERTFKVYIYKDGVRPLVHTGPTVGIYASEGRFIEQLESSKGFITSDPNKAHLFFMPYSVTNLVRKLYVPDSHSMQPITSFVTSYVTTISSKYQYWNWSHGADHFFLSCHDWGPATARENVELRQNAIKVVCNADVNEEFVVGKDVSLPETYLRAAKPPTKLGGPHVKKRPYLAE
ncbi:hypothetical protein L7F22_064495 [Adiantum nelumboides]|nr:hypothetical protein [Adiantum nelumboides]